MGLVTTAVYSVLDQSGIAPRHEAPYPFPEIDVRSLMHQFFGFGDIEALSRDQWQLHLAGEAEVGIKTGGLARARVKAACMPMSRLPI